MRLLALLLIIISIPTYALDIPDRTDGVNYGIIVTWTAPTTRPNGVAYQPGDIAGYEIYYGIQGGETFEPIVTGAVEEYTIEGIDPGTYDVSMRLIGADGLYSPATAPISVTINPVNENSPPSNINLSVQVNLTISVP